MKKFTTHYLIPVLLMSLILIVSCDDAYKHEKQKVDKGVVTNWTDGYWNFQYKIITIDQCEYIYVVGNGLAHKGNCKYCFQRSVKGIDTIMYLPDSTLTLPNVGNVDGDLLFDNAVKKVYNK